MRKAIVVLVAGLLLLVAFAAPAFALRDPFDPVVDLTPDTGGGGGGGGQEEATRADVGGSGGTEGATITNSETLANTGSDVEPWMVVAYGLIAAGAAGVALSKTFSPARTRR